MLISGRLTRIVEITSQGVNAQRNVMSPAATVEIDASVVDVIVENVANVVHVRKSPSRFVKTTRLSPLLLRHLCRMGLIRRTGKSSASRQPF
jgi:hypothetical protein